MKRGSTTHVAVGTAFARSVRGPDGVVPSTQRLHPGAIAFVAGFPGVVGSAMVLAAFSRDGPDDGAFAPGIVLVAVAGLLLVLGLRSFFSVRADGLTVRFYGLRSTTILFTEVRSATFSMTAPSISYAITLTDVARRKAIVHANWWRNERSIVRPVCQALLDHHVPLDRSV